MTSFEDAAAILTLRQASDSTLKRGMIAVRERYNGDTVIPLPDVEGEPTVDPPVPALIAMTIDDTAMRAASTRPMTYIPALHDSALSRKKAENRRRACSSAWHENKLPLILRRAFRHLVGYGTDAMVVEPDFNTQSARIGIRDPLCSYPDDSAAEEVRSPVNVGFIYPRSPSWIKQAFPYADDGTRTEDYIGSYESDVWDLFEWIDIDNIYLGILGPRQLWGGTYNAYRGNPDGVRALKLRSWENRTDLVPVMCPARVTLDRVAGQVSKVVGMIDMMGRLMALEAVAAEKSVFADKYAIGKDGETPMLISGNQWQDGRTGEINLLSNVAAIGELAHPLNQGTFNVADRTERAIRQSAGQPGIFGGELTGAIRSGQTLLQAGAYAIDPRVQEVQEIMEYQLSGINEAVLATMKGYWPQRKYTIFSGWPTDRGYAEFTPAEDFERYDNVVSYGFTGADVNQVTVALGQANVAKMMSRRSAMRKHPLVDDADGEERALVEEGLTDAVLGSLMARSQQGTVSEVDLLEIVGNYRTSGDLIDAVNKANQAAQERQAKQAGTDQPAVPPETQPGLSPAQMAGMESQPAPPPRGLQDLQMRLARLGQSRNGNGQVPAGV